MLQRILKPSPSAVKDDAEHQSKSRFNNERADRRRASARVDLRVDVAVFMNLKKHFQASFQEASVMACLNSSLA